jgi:hypothetical protein
MTTIQRSRTTYSLALLTPKEALGEGSLRREWESLRSFAHPLNRVFASPGLYKHQCQIAPLPENRVGVVRDAYGKAVGICPIVLWRLAMPLYARKRVFGKICLRAATILSGQPLLQTHAPFFKLLFEGLMDGLPWCDCIYINSMAVDSFLCNFIYGQEHDAGCIFIHPRQLESREWLYLALGESRDELLAEKKGTTRYQLRRRVKKLRELGGGVLECKRFETEDQVGEFYESARTVAEHSWQYERLGQRLDETALRCESLLNLARLGYLRAYLLKCGGRPCSFVIGYQHDDVLHVQQTAYSREFAHQSPGSVLYYLMLEDLHLYRRPALVNYGVGVTPHKRLFTNRVTFDASAYLFRPTIWNRLRCAGHSLFYAGLKQAKGLLTKQRLAPPRENGIK